MSSPKRPPMEKDNARNGESSEQGPIDCSHGSEEHRNESEHDYSQHGSSPDDNKHSPNTPEDEQDGHPTEIDQHEGQHEGGLGQEETNSAEKFWTNKEIDLPIDLKDEKQRSWNEIAVSLPGRSSSAVANKYWFMKKNRATSPNVLAWTDKQDILLRACVNEKKLSWDDVALRFSKRTKNAIRQRYHQISSASSKQVFWTKEEVDSLIQLKDEDLLKWREISARIPGRSMGACRKKYKEEKESRSLRS